MNKLSEADICLRFITPAIASAGWSLSTQVRQEYQISAGRVRVSGGVATRGARRRADYVLFIKPGIPIAVVEAKDASRTVGAGMQQALDYARRLQVPFAFSSNGEAFLFHDATVKNGVVEKMLQLDEMPSPEELWGKYLKHKNLTSADQRNIVEQDYYQRSPNKSPRHYQSVAVNRTLEEIARGRNRILLVMATGTGKTYTAFQIMWRLRRAGRARRILFLADRNILVDQARLNDFAPFGSVMTKVSSRTIDKSYEVYLALYQSVMGPEEYQNIYKSFSPDFFDLVVVDECHRGSADEDSAWRAILEYFSSAVQIGLTATPRETVDVSNIEYFGDPTYIYSLRQGIEDGYLAPYKVVRVSLDRDETGWRPRLGEKDERGNLIPDRLYTLRDMDRTLVIRERTETVAERIAEFLKQTDRYSKTIVFCEDVDHAERMRQALTNANSDITTSEDRYVMRITGDSQEGKLALSEFIMPDAAMPVIATTSKLLSTGVDVPTCKLIVLDKTIGSLAEFKQIIGRGTRIDEDRGKLFFTIMDFRGATRLFADPEFDGPPIQVYEPREDESPVPPGPEMEDEPAPQEGGMRKFFIFGVPIAVIGEQVQYHTSAGQVITEPLRQYTARVTKQMFPTYASFVKAWAESDSKTSVLEKLRESGVLIEALEDEAGRECDYFDLIGHFAYDNPLVTRAERVAQARADERLQRYSGAALTILSALLDKYSEGGIYSLEDIRVLQLQPLAALGTPLELIRAFRNRQGYDAAILDLKKAIYGEAS